MILALAGSTANAQNGAATSCAGCHRGQATQTETPMAHAIELPDANPVLAAHPSLTFQSGAYTWTVETHNGQSTYKVSDGSASLAVPIHWSFGAQAQTWVFEQDGKFYESLVSFYPSANGLGITTGDERLTPQTLQEAMGRELTPEDAKLCFGCHASDAVIARTLTLSKVHPGVTCAHCHQGALGHASDAALSDFSSAPPRLQDMTAESISNFCGQCHRSWETVVRNGWRGVPDVRFQPYRLANSRCFNGTDPRISCIACHDPHKNLSRNDASYDPKCLACHAANARPTSTGKAKTCPVSSSDCISCHMPKVTLPGGHLRFTDHQIRVVEKNAPFPD